MARKISLILILVIVPLLGLQSLNAQAENQETSSTRLRTLEAKKVPVPMYLFHWTSPESLEALAKEIDSAHRLPLKKIGLSGFAYQVSYFKDNQGLFVWTHPAGAMSAGPEKYARPGSQGDPPRLIVIRPFPDARAIAVDTDLNTVWKEEDVPQELKKADLVFHRSLSSSGNVRYQEWIILNPKAIQGFSADPRHLPSEIRRKIENAISSSGELAPDELFFPKTDDPEFRKTTLKAYLDGGSRGIPDAFSAALNPPTLECRKSALSRSFQN